jgi:hypothetical protein
VQCRKVMEDGSAEDIKEAYNKLQQLEVCGVPYVLLSTLSALATD